MSLHDQFLKNRWTISLAESCTGGSISAKFVEVPGASHYFLGSVIVYSNFLKQKLLQIPSSLLENEGAVSAPCASLMCKNLYKITETSWTGSITGIAGPDGGTAEKPVGTVFMALSFMGQEAKVKKCLFVGDRLEILQQSQQAFLSFLNESIISPYER